MEVQNKYAVVDKQTTEVVARGLRTRREARLVKRDLEYKNLAANNHQPLPSRYFVETDVDHPNGPGIYLH